MKAEYPVSDRELGVPADCMDSYFGMNTREVPLFHPYEFDTQDVEELLTVLARRALRQVGAEGIEHATLDNLIAASHSIRNGGMPDLEKTFKGEICHQQTPWFHFDDFHSLLSQQLDLWIKTCDV